jgi:hypothetical protein
MVTLGDLGSLIPRKGHYTYTFTCKDKSNRCENELIGRLMHSLDTFSTYWESSGDIDPLPDVLETLEKYDTLV